MGGRRKRGGWLQKLAAAWAERHHNPRRKKTDRARARVREPTSFAMPTSRPPLISPSYFSCCFQRLQNKRITQKSTNRTQLAPADPFSRFGTRTKLAPILILKYEPFGALPPLPHTHARRQTRDFKTTTPKCQKNTRSYPPPPSPSCCNPYAYTSSRTHHKRYVTGFTKNKRPTRSSFAYLILATALFDQHHRQQRKNSTQIQTEAGGCARGRRG